MAHPLRSPSHHGGRRARRAALVTAVLALLLVSTLAVTLALQGDAPPAFGVAPAHPGDAWVYNVSHARTTANGSEPLPDTWIQVQAQRGESTTANLPDGRAVPAVALAETHHHQDGEAAWTLHDQYRLDPENGATLQAGRGRFVGVGDATLTGDVPRVGPIESAENEHRIENTTRLGGFGPTCGHTNDLQGQRFTHSTLVGVAGACGEGATDRIRVFRHLGTAPVPEGSAEVYGLEGDATRVQLWFHASYPIPVQVAIRTDDNGTHRVLRLVHFERGEVPAFDWAPATRLPAPTVQAAGGLGPDAAGIDHPFPLKDADAAARADPGLAAWLGRAPAPALVEAGYHERVYRLTADRYEAGNAPGIDRVWILTYARADEGYTVSVVREDRGQGAGAPAPLLSPLAPVQATAAPPAVTRLSAPDAPFPTASQLPATLPTVASMLAVWEALGGTLAEEDWAPSYGFRHACADAACQTVDSTVRVGDDRRVEVEGATVWGVVATRFERLVVLADDSGRLVGVDSVEHRQVAYTATPLFTIGDDPGTAPAPSLFAAAAAPVPWLGPFLVPAVALTLLALLVGVAYSLFPALKSWWATVLFHREAPDLLANPVRAEILETVRAEPGIHHKELMRRVGHGNHVVSHHLARLQRGRMVSVARGPGYVCYFPTGGTDRRLMAAAPALKSQVAKRMLDLVRNEPGMTGTRLAAALGIAPATVTYHIKRLAEAGLVHVERSGRLVRVRPTALATAA